MLEINVELLETINGICAKAGIAALEVYQRDFNVETKGDKSPLTEADLASHQVITQALTELFPGVPILSEEGDIDNWSERQNWQQYWLVDPLDGTKEFVNKNGEFTINIALIQNNTAVLGSVYAPALNTLYCGALGLGSFKQIEQQQPVAIFVEDVVEQRPLNVVVSRSHPSDELASYLQELGECNLIEMGSSLKLCLVAEGYADLYPRLGPTSEWDIAAAQAIVEAAGGKVMVFESQEPLKYNTKQSLLNPYFIASS